MPVVSSHVSLTKKKKKKTADSVSYNSVKEKEIKARFTQLTWRIMITEFLLTKCTVLFFKINFFFFLMYVEKDIFDTALRGRTGFDNYIL